MQLSRLRRTHLMPTSESDLRLLGRACGTGLAAEAVVAQWQRAAARVRRLHERLFYRPLLSAVARLWSRCRRRSRSNRATAESSGR